MASFECIDLSEVEFTSDLLRHIPGDVARRFRVIPVFEASGDLCIAIADPSRLAVIDELAYKLNRDFQVLQADKQQLDASIGQLYPE